MNLININVKSVNSLAGQNIFSKVTSVLTDLGKGEGEDGKKKY